MEYARTFICDGVDYSVKMSEEDITAVLDDLLKFYSNHGVHGEAIQQSKGSQSNAIDLVTKMCDYHFRIMENEDE